MNKEDVLILGAGPAGMAAAFELHGAGRPFLVIEKNDLVGGLARTLQFGEFRTDIGPHRFYSRNQYLYAFIEELLGEQWIPVDRITRFFINGTFFSYPVELKNALRNVGFFKASRILIDYLSERSKKIVLNRIHPSFEAQIISDFGRTLAELNMLNYTEKLWGLPCSQISPDWSKQRIKGLSFLEVVKKMFIKSAGGSKTLVERFYYPDSGAGLIYEKMQERISKEGNLRFNTRPVQIVHKHNKIAEVNVTSGDDTYRINPAYVISSIPITLFVHMIEPAPPAEVLHAVKKLRFRSHVSFFLTIDKPSVFDDQWIYFPDKEIPFCRIMEPKNFSRKMSPPDKTSLLVEFFCWENDAIWNADKDALCGLCIPWLEKIGFIKKDDIINSFIHREKYAYPVYDLDYKKHLTTITRYLNQFKNLQCLGRSGSFRYNNQDHALEMGILAARNIIEGKRYNIEEVGEKQEYFEKGPAR